MQLTDVQAKRFWPIDEEHQKGLDILNERSLRAIRDHARNLQGVSDDTVRKLVDDWLAIDADRLKPNQPTVAELRTALADKRVMR